jgi:hypothetical protein
MTYAIDPSAWTQYNASNGYKAYQIQNLPYGNGQAGNEANPKSNMINEFGGFSSSNMDRNIIQTPRNNSGTAYLALKDELNASDVQLTYELLEPIVITGLTPAILRTLLGYNAIWADCGAVDVSYRADTKLFVEQSIAEANAVTRKMIADTANGNLAPKSLDSGDLIIVGEELRKCTANIGLGNAITDSNSTVATLADVIKALQ